MVQTVAISDNLTLKYLRDRFNLQRSEDPPFFTEWTENLPELSGGDRTFLARIKAAKRTTFSLSLAIPQALAYMLANPARDKPSFGIL
jgi:hypothetical protein